MAYVYGSDGFRDDWDTENLHETTTIDGIALIISKGVAKQV